MLDELLKSSPGTSVPGDDPLAAVGAPTVTDAVPGSAGAVSFAEPAPTPAAEPVQSPAAQAAAPVNPLSAIPGIVLDGASENNGNVPVPPTPKKKKEPMRPADFLKIVGALFLVALIFFGSFLAYVVFNPEQAQFFIQFGINRADIQTLLARLVNAIFGAITFSLSVVWVVYLFRMILTKKEYKRKKTVATILATFFGVLLFSNITFWAFLVQKIGAQDFANPNGGVKIYDNDRLLSDQFKDSSELAEFNNLIGPTTLKFDLTSDAGYVTKKYMKIESFEIDFDGDGSPDKEGADPSEANDLIHTYAKKGKYVPKGTYVGKNNITGEEMTRPMELPVINVSAVVNVTKTKKGTVFDAKDTSMLGSPKWYESSNLNVPVSTAPVYTAKISKEERFLCLALVTNKTKEENCNKIFVIRPEGDSPVDAKIVVERVRDDQLTYHFSLEDVKVRTGGEVAAYRWVLDTGTVFCQREECDYVFAEYGKQKFTVFLTDAAGNTADIAGEVDVRRPLNLMRSEGDDPLLRVMDESEENLLKGNFDKSTDSYRINDFTVPSKLVFDATDVRVRNTGYSLESVDWTFGNGGGKKSGLRVEYELVRDGRFEVTVRYVFHSSADDNRGEVIERIVFDGKKKDLAANLSISSPDSKDENFYAPTTIRFDGSASRTKSGNITKFVYDFGLGRAPAEGDAVQTIRYDNPGEYAVSLTVVKDDGSKDTVTRKIVIKDVPKTLKINSSVSSGIVGSGIDFDVSGSSGQIETYSWDFGDGTVPSAEPMPTHAFESPGTFTVKLQVRYADATVKSVEKEIEIKEAVTE